MSEMGPNSRSCCVTIHRAQEAVALPGRRGSEGPRTLWSWDPRGQAGWHVRGTEWRNWAFPFPALHFGVLLPPPGRGDPLAWRGRAVQVLIPMWLGVGCREAWEAWEPQHYWSVGGTAAPPTTLTEPESRVLCSAPFWALSATAILPSSAREVLLPSAQWRRRLFYTCGRICVHI